MRTSGRLPHFAAMAQQPSPLRRLGGTALSVGGTALSVAGGVAGWALGRGADDDDGAAPAGGTGGDGGEWARLSSAELASRVDTLAARVEWAADLDERELCVVPAPSTAVPQSHVVGLLGSRGLGGFFSVGSRRLDDAHLLCLFSVGPPLRSDESPLR